MLLFLILSNLRLLSFLVSLAKGLCKFCWSFQRSNFWFHWSEFVFEEKFCFSASSFGAFILVSISTEVLFSSGCSVFKMMALFSFDEWSYIGIDLNRKSSPFSEIGLATFWQVQQAWDGNKGKSPLRMLKSVTVIVGLTLFAKSKFNQTQISKCKHFLYLLPYSQMPSHHLSSTDRTCVHILFPYKACLLSPHKPTEVSLGGEAREEILPVNHEASPFSTSDTHSLSPLLSRSALPSRHLQSVL